MKQTLHSLGIAFVALSLMVGCGQKKKKNMKIEKEMEMMQDIDLANIAPEEDFFDESEMDELGDLEQFAFLNEEENQMAPSEDAFAQGVEAPVEDLFAYTPEANNQENLSFKPLSFAYNESHLRNDQQAVLQDNIELARQAVEEGKNVLVSAYRCQMGDAARNMKLSEETANNVKNEMIAQGIPADRIVALGFGQENPIVSSDATDKKVRIKELAPNRRVEISVS